MPLLIWGYAIGDPDGRFGARTRRAIAAFQQREQIEQAQAMSIEQRLPLQHLFRCLRPLVVRRAFLMWQKVSRLRTLRASKQTNAYFAPPSAYEGRRWHMANLAGRSTSASIRPLPVGSMQHCPIGCGAHLVSIGSQEENEFVFELIEHDEKMFQTGFDGQYTYRRGPWIGLVQDQAATEPGGGWLWATGEDVTYSNWSPGRPSSSYAGDDFALFYSQRKGKTDGSDIKARSWKDDGVGSPVRGYIIEFD